MKTDWGGWFDKNIYNDWRWEGHFFADSVREADKKHGTLCGAAVLLARIDDMIGFQGEHNFCDMDELQIMFDSLSYNRQNEYCWDFVRRHTDQARDMFISTQNLIEPEEEEEAAE